MSVLIKGMKLPDEPRNCKFYDIDPMGYREPYCKIQSVCNGLEDCPLIEVPEPHGRLIDADALLSLDMQIYDGEMAVGRREYIFCFEVEDAPTVIEAEDGE